MTKNTQMLLRRKIMASRLRLMKSHSFFALMLMYVKFAAVPGMKQISTDGECIFFAPEFLLSLGAGEIDYLLCHQIMHILRGDIWRPPALAGDKYHYLCDEETEKLLNRCGLQKKFCAHYRCIGPVKDDAKRRMVDTDAFWSASGGSGYKSIPVLGASDDDPWCTPLQMKGEAGAESETAGIKAKWESRMAAAAAIYDMQNDPECQWVSEMLQRGLGKAKEPAVNWRKVLREFMEERTYDYSFSPPDKRYESSPFFLPDFNDDDYQIRDILFWVDTSGSVNDDALAAVYAEISFALAQFGGKLEGKLGFFDTSASKLHPFRTVSDLRRIVPVGGGGTDFSVPFACVEMEYPKQRPACMVIFTDGLGRIPPEEAAMGIPVLWVFTEKDAKSPWGKCVWLQ